MYYVDNFSPNRGEQHSETSSTTSSASYYSKGSGNGVTGTYDNSPLRRSASSTSGGLASTGDIIPPPLPKTKPPSSKSSLKKGILKGKQDTYNVPRVIAK